MGIRVYIAGPISKGDLAHNVNQATAAFVELAEAGFAPFCPHWSVYSKPAVRLWTPYVRLENRKDVWEPHDVFQPVVCEATVQGNDRLSHADWLNVDLPWVEASQAVLRLPGESSGADREVGHANAIRIPVFYSIADLIAWRDAGNFRAA